MEKDDIILSVYVATYNHENYIIRRLKAKIFELIKLT